MIPGGPGRCNYLIEQPNHNKRSIALDLKQEKDRAILKKLVATADVFVENYRPGAFEALPGGVTQKRAQRMPGYDPLAAEPATP